MGFNLHNPAKMENCLYTPVKIILTYAPPTNPFYLLIYPYDQKLIQRFNKKSKLYFHKICKLIFPVPRYEQLKAFCTIYIYICKYDFHEGILAIAHLYRVMQAIVSTSKQNSTSKIELIHMLNKIPTKVQLQLKLG